jgi:hypothetical protein
MSKRLLCLLVVGLSANQSDCFTPPMKKRPHSTSTRNNFHLATTNKDNKEDTGDSSTKATNSDDGMQYGYTPRNLGDITRELIRSIAKLSLEDYKWRSDVFKTMTANRLVENSLARMMGDASPGYVRPMDAPERGPLGVAEESAVTWLSSVIEEEGRRAQLIMQADGVLVRPIDAAKEAERGPLAEIEQNVVDFFSNIKASEQLRKSLGILRPKDMDESQRGPLGNAEFRLYQALKELSNSEAMRYEQSKQRADGGVVRPLDVPGPLGEVEAAVLEIFKAEQQRAREAKKLKSSSEMEIAKVVLRPMNAAVPGPLGEAEQEAIRAFQRLSEEERERLRGILKTLEDNRPMETNRDSILGVVEAVIVGILRAPQMLFSVIDRVSELMRSEPLPIIEMKEGNVKMPNQPLKKTTLKMPPVEQDDELGAFE